MAWTEFYINFLGSNLNAGSTTSLAAAYTSTNGNWSTTTNAFTPVDGSTPASSISVGDWVSIYLDAASVTLFVAQVTAVAAGANGAITVSTTAKYGTAPVTGATGRSLKAGGAHVDEIVWTTGGGIGIGTAPAPTRINWKSSNFTVTANRTFAIAGTVTAPVWFRGYNGTPGDCDSDPTLQRPVLALNSTFGFTLSGAHQIWSSFNITGNRSSAIWATTQGGNFFRIRIENIGSGASGVALSMTSGGAFVSCWFKAATTATTNGVMSMSSVGATFVNCVAEGGGLAGFNLNTSGCVAVGCLALNNTGAGILVNGTGARVVNCTVYNATGDGLKWTSVASSGSIIAACLFSNCGGIGINNTGGTTDNVFRSNNAFFSCSGGNEAGFGDTASLFEVGESASPFVNAAGGDLSLAPAALSRQAGTAPGLIENALYQSFLSIGAVQPAIAGGPVGRSRSFGSIGTY